MEVVLVDGRRLVTNEFRHGLARYLASVLRMERSVHGIRDERCSKTGGVSSRIEGANCDPCSTTGRG